MGQYRHERFKLNMKLVCFSRVQRVMIKGVLVTRAFLKKIFVGEMLIQTHISPSSRLGTYAEFLFFQCF